MRLTTYVNAESIDIHKTYYAEMSESNYQKESVYLMDVFKLNHYPIFCVVDGMNGSSKGLDKSTGSYISIEVPDNECNIMDYYNWTDFLNSSQTCNTRRMKELLDVIKTQKQLNTYNMPQVIIDRIEPEWIKYVGPVRDYSENVKIIKNEIIQLSIKCMNYMKELQLTKLKHDLGNIILIDDKLVILCNDGYFLFEDNNIYGLANPVDLTTKTSNFNTVLAYTKISLFTLLTNFKYLEDIYGEYEFMNKIAEYIKAKQR